MFEAWALWLARRPYTAMSLAIGLIQFAVTAGFFLRLRREFSTPRPAFSPPVAVLVPAKGRVFELERNVAAMLDQDYAGPVEYLFVVAKREDPAYKLLEELLPRLAGDRARLLCSEAVPRICSEQVLNLLHALDHASPRAAVLLFADCDIRPPRGWIADLVAPLADPSVGAASTSMLYPPSSASFPGFLRLLWMGAGIAYMSLNPFVWAGSFAMRREEFSSFGVPEAWRRCVSNDGVIHPLIKASGKRVAFVARAMPASNEGCSLAGLIAHFNRWILYCRFHRPDFWVFGLAGVCAKIGLWVWTLAPGHGLRPLVLLCLLDMANLALVFLVFRRFLPDRFAAIAPPYRAYPLLAGLCAPLLPFIYAVNFLHSLGTDTVHWGGYAYRIRSPLDVEATPLA